MGENSSIEWTTHSFNPWIGCTKVSPGCANCYAEADDKRRKWTPQGWGKGKPRRLTAPSTWAKPAKWDEEARLAGRRDRVFCASLADVFDAEAPPGALNALWMTIRATPNLDWLLLTKRPERILQSLPYDWGTGWPNVWLGTSIEDQRRADERIPHLMAVPARVRFLSCEPLLGPVDLSMHLGIAPQHEELRGALSWVICGGESGHGARPMDIAWARTLRDQCASAGTAFFFKQLGAQLATQTQKGGQLEEIPDDLRVRQFPGVA